MPRPHKHPSITCYKQHKCRCDPCKAINAETKSTERRSRQTKLSPEKLAELRRAVGLPPV